MKEAEGDIRLKSRKVDAKAFTEKRNSRITEFFNKRGISVQLKGNPQNPMIVLNDSLCLSAYAKNFYLKFLDRPNQGNLVEEIKLTHENIKTYPTKKLVELIENNQQTGMFKIRLKNTDLALVGYEHAARDSMPLVNGSLLYPVFGTLRPHLYKTEDMAEEVFDKLKSRYPIEIIQMSDKL